jgi:hypothetical protein
MALATLLKRNHSDLALVVGNGINRYGVPTGENSWDNLLSKLARSILSPNHKAIPSGVSLTEFYDVLELSYTRTVGQASLQQQFCTLMATWRPLRQHELIASWASQRNVPVLTTNFENTLGAAVTCSIRRAGGNKFTDYYPWDTYFSTNDIVDPCAHFAIWHINGMQQYRRSVRLGLSHYMGSVERARSWLHKGNKGLFNDGDAMGWRGASTWLQVFFHKPLLIFGLGLSETEVFLRWLLIERARYFRKFPEHHKSGWYIYVQGQHDEGKELFLKAVGIKSFAVSSHDDIYAASNWLT